MVDADVDGEEGVDELLGYDPLSLSALSATGSGCGNSRTARTAVGATADLKAYGWTPGVLAGCLSRDLLGVRKVVDAPDVRRDDFRDGFQDGGPTDAVERRLFFQVSRYTGRIHLWQQVSRALGVMATASYSPDLSKCRGRTRDCTVGRTAIGDFDYGCLYLPPAVSSNLT